MARKAGPVGRDDVLAELRRVVDEAVAGRGHLLLLAGEAGIGKTTMLTAAAGLAEGRGVRVAWGWGWPGEGAPGYWPWVQVMRMLGLDIPWPAEDSGQPVGDAPASERFRLFDEVTSLLLAESRIQPLLLLLDDLQWADQPSQLLLDFLARRLPAGAVAVVGGYRDTEHYFVSVWLRVRGVIRHDAGIAEVRPRLLDFTADARRAAAQGQRAAGEL